MAKKERVVEKFFKARCVSPERKTFDLEGTRFRLRQKEFSFIRLIKKRRQREICAKLPLSVKLKKDRLYAIRIQIKLTNGNLALGPLQLAAHLVSIRQLPAGKAVLVKNKKIFIR